MQRISAVIPGGSNWWPVIALTLLAVLAGCASLPEDYPRTESSALDDYASTTIGRRHAPLEEAHPGKSGFALLRYGRNAFTARLRMGELTEKTIDVQVYIWEPDETGRIFAERLIRAADRGVRVRMLVDDLGFGGKDRALGALDSHPNIEIRVFNPFANRDNPGLGFITDLNRVNHRMHNKIVIMDNAFAIVGGRNIGDHYFAVNPDTNFRDLDIIAVGPVVRDVSSVFDRFWRSESSIPAAAIIDEAHSEEDLRRFTEMIREEINAGSYPYSIDKDLSAFERDLAHIEERYVWARGLIVWDDPAFEKVDHENGGELVTKLRRKLETVEKSLVIESAYFVIGDRGVETVRRLADRDVKVRVLTNSLVSNDVLAAHAGHAEFRKPLLEAGAELYEMRPDSAVIKKTWVGESRAGLHTKALVFDDESLLIGSFNLDPRSANINTEAGVYVESPELAAQLLAYMDEGIEPHNAYRVELDTNGDLVWITEIDGAEVRYDRDPLSTFGQRLMSDLIELLPLESQL